MGFVYSLIYLVAISIIVFLIGRFYPRRWIFENSFPFRSFACEKEGKCYEKIWIRKWKTIWPDASMILHGLFPKHYPKKRLENNNTEKIPVLIKESCVAESTHIITSILGFGCIFVWNGLGGIIMSIVYFLTNIPPIIIQRYNRPRLKKSLKITERCQRLKEYKLKYEEIEEGPMPESIGKTVSAG